MIRCVAFIVLAFLGTSFQLKGQEAHALEAIQLLMSQEQLMDALQLSKEIEIDSSHLSDLLNLRAQCEYKLGHWDESKRSSLHVIDRDSSNVESHERLAKIYKNESNWPKAVKHASALLLIQPNRLQYLKLAGLLDAKLGEDGSAIRLLSTAFNKTPKDVVIGMELGRLFLKVDSVVHADSVIHSLLSSNPNHIGLHKLAARIAYRLKNYQAAVNEIEFVMESVDLNHDFTKLLGYAYLQIDSFDQAIFQFENLIHSKEGEQIHYYLAIAYSKKEQAKEALFHYDQAINKSISKKIHIYCQNASRLQYDEKNITSAIDYLRLGHRLTENDEFLFDLAQLCDIYYKDKSMAIRYYRRYVQSENNNPSDSSYARERVNYLKELKHQQEKN